MRRSVDIAFNGKTYTVKPTFSTIERIEQRFDMLSFLRSVQMYRSKVKDVAWILYVVLSESGESLTYEEVGEVVLDDIAEATAAAGEVIAAAVSAGPEKMPKETAKKK
jgi:hypothetical protein